MVADPKEEERKLEEINRKLKEQEEKLNKE